MNTIRNILAVMAVVIALGVVSAEGALILDSFRDMEESNTVQFVESYLDTSIPAYHNLMFRDPVTSIDAPVVKDESIWHVGFINYVPGGMVVVGDASNDNGWSNDTPELPGWLQGLYTSDIGDGNRPDDILIVHDVLGNGIGELEYGVWSLGLDDILYTRQDILFGPDQIRGAVELLPVYEVPGTAILPEMIVAPIPEPITGRHVFYNNSAFDGYTPDLNVTDGTAIATDKSALLPGQTASFVNYSSFSRGINGIMIDIATLTAAPTVADFEFKVGNSNDPSTWVTAPAPESLSVDEGEGVSGADRVAILWADNAIQNQWLQVTVKANATTGLSVADVFYFGNAIGETGNSATDAEVTPADEIGVRNNPHNIKNSPAAITDAYDFNRDKKVGPTDLIHCRNNGTNSSTALQLITVP